MIGRRAIAGTWTMLLLAFMVTTVPNAAAATKGGTLYTCVKGGPGGTFKTEHCKATDGTGSAYGHVAVPANTTTESLTSNETTGGARETVSLTSTQAGIAFEMQANLLLGSGWIENRVAESGEHYSVGGGVLEIKEIEIAKPAGKGCKVKGGQVTTNPVVTTTKEQGDFVKTAPASGVVFAEFQLEGCTGSKAIESLNGPYTASGSFKAVGNGATSVATSSETTAQETLFIREQKAGINGPLTNKGRDPVSDPAGSYTPLSGTTVETP